MVRGLFWTSIGSGGFRPSRTQRGVSLLLALIFVGFFGGILITLTRFNSYEIRKAEARVTGWELVEIGKAARLYVRDRYALDRNMPTSLAGSGPQRIQISTLISQGYLSPSFGRTVGTDNLTALNQQIYVIMANWSPLGLPAAIDSTVVPSAFVYLSHGGKSSSDLAINIVESARAQGASITAPLYDRTGANRSAICRGQGPAVGLWDTGCMTANEFAQLASAVGAPSTTFEGGAVIMPAWKAVQPDLRAVMRYPQPENPGFATMLTDLNMGTPTDTDGVDDNICNNTNNQVTMTTGDSGSLTSRFTGVCDVNDDTASNNRRFSITRAGSLVAERVVAEAQDQDFTGETTAVTLGNANDQVLALSGDALLGSDLRVYNVRNMPTTGSVPAARFSMSNASSTLAVERNSYLYSQNIAARGAATVGTITQSNALITDSMTTPRFNSMTAGTPAGGTPQSGAQPQINVTTRTRLSGHVTVAGDPSAEYITDTMTGNTATVFATESAAQAAASGGQVQVTGTLNMGGNTMTVQGAAPGATGYAAIVGEIVNAGEVGVDNNLQFLETTTGSLTVGARGAPTVSTVGYSGGPMPTITTSGRCQESTRLAGGCPERQYFPAGITP